MRSGIPRLTNQVFYAGFFINFHTVLLLCVSLLRSVFFIFIAARMSTSIVSYSLAFEMLHFIVQ